MRKGLKIFLIVLAVLVAAAGAVVIWQWDNLRAVSLSVQHSREDLSQMRTDARKQVEQTTQSIEGVTVRDLTEEEHRALASDELSREEIIARLTGKALSESAADAAGEAQMEESPADAAPQGQVSADTAGSPAAISDTAAAAAVDAAPAADPNANTNADAGPTPEDQLAACLAEIYVMKSEYTSWLENLYTAAIGEYTELPAEEQTPTAKYRIGMSCMQQALDKEDECDAQMAELEAQIAELLTQMGRDLSLIDEIQAAYEEEKEITKAYYLGLHS